MGSTGGAAEPGADPDLSCEAGAAWSKTILSKSEALIGDTLFLAGPSSSEMACPCLSSVALVAVSFPAFIASRSCRAKFGLLGICRLSAI